MSDIEEEDEAEAECSSLPANDDDYDDDDGACETDDSREDVRFIDACRPEAKKCRRRQTLTSMRSDCKTTAGRRITGCQTSGRKLATDSSRSDWNEETGRSGDRSKRDGWPTAGDCGSEERSGGLLQSNLDPDRSGDRSDADLRRRAKSNWRAECSDGKLLCDEDRQFLSQA